MTSSIFYHIYIIFKHLERCLLFLSYKFEESKIISNIENETVQLSKRDIKRQKIKEKLIDAPDIMYRCIFSYRVLRIFAWISLAELLAVGIPLLTRMSGTPLDRLIVFLYADALGIGQTMSMIFAIPFIMLYSYTRSHKNKTIDIAIPIASVALLALVYLEGIYQIAVDLVGH